MIQLARKRKTVGSLALQSLVLTVAVACVAPPADGQDRFVRHRKPDRGSYQSPVLGEDQGRGTSASADGLVDAVLEEAAPVRVQPPPAEVMQVGYVEGAPQTATTTQQVSSEEVLACSCPECSQHGGGMALASPTQAYGPMVTESSMSSSLSPFVEATCGCESIGCDGLGCDGLGCDPFGCDSLGICGGNRDWFGSLELLLMFRKGDRVLPLVTSTTTDPPVLETAGVRGEADTIAIFGDEKLLDGMTAGGRLTIGSWLDRYKDRSIVLRGWFAGEETSGFATDDIATAVITRPFFDVSDGITPEESTLVVAFPDLASGSISVQADSNVYGADISMRQLWYKGMGGTIDLLYGYQYLGLDESLAISSTSTSLSDDFAPVGSVRSVIDDFDVENDFHGGQLGIATNYREGCWSFSSLAKVGFGSLSRRVTRTGTDFRSIDANNFTDPNGLLIRSTNSGERTDNTFSWVPELDFTLGWQHFPSFDVTVGYHVIAVTDAVQVSGTIDPELASNLVDPPVGAQRPSPTLRDNTFYVQGIHFGLNYIW
ncbi:MAG: BBP7 family outer membrane beta-barrel protein [Planctomycetota bacterium]